ncbi:hypothetical protein EV143_101611 [Flavobacterium chryseum]|uniref:hypothetical protein n=1 Tax=Flavobacterium sp. P3160 TaxID=2512113 RepID=UPI00105E4C5E|nr:hypothetical protein [Flavobacterium sp. P3160]TDO84166.1 hypothetical protein EV143_101611 [Flavobacterium sp. P3160]
MRFKTIIAILTLLSLSSCTKEIPPSIKLKVEYSDKSKKEIPRIYFIDVYKDGKIFKKYERFRKPHIEKEILMDSLTNGEYEFVYLNFLNQSLTKTVEIKENKQYTISINPDYSDYKDFIDKSLVRNLEDNQKVEFFYKSSGCFHSLEGNLIVNKKDNTYYAESRGSAKKLNKKELDAIIKMECELNLLQKGGCTTNDHYIVKFGNEEKEFNDRTCAWEGWTNMFKQINLKYNF